MASIAKNRKISMRDIELHTKQPEITIAKASFLYFDHYIELIWHPIVDKFTVYWDNSLKDDPQVWEDLTGEEAKNKYNETIEEIMKVDSTVKPL